MENKIKHLEMVQNVISRMAGNSFLIKSWCVTLVSALLVLSSRNANILFILVAFFPVLMFWILDAFFLRQERLFRRLYDEIRFLDEKSVDFSMNTSPFVERSASWLKVAFSGTLVLFYVTIVGSILIVFLFVRIVS